MTVHAERHSGRRGRFPSRRRNAGREALPRDSVAGKLGGSVTPGTPAVQCGLGIPEERPFSAIVSFSPEGRAVICRNGYKGGYSDL
jgi:hypothetical protein